MVKITRTVTNESGSINLLLSKEGTTTLTFGSTRAESANDDLPAFDVKFHFTADATFDTMLHFHTDKTEYIYVDRGTARVTLNGVSRMVDSSAGEIEIPRWTPHRWEVLGGEETVVLERTFPVDGRKEAFFRNFIGLINDYGALPPFLQTFQIFAEWDNYPIGEAGWMSSLEVPIVWLTKAVGLVAKVAGYSAMYKEYTPQELYDKLE